MMSSLITFPPWIQAVAAVCLTFLTAWTLAVLRGYARDTRTLALSSVAQVENAQKPFVALVSRSPLNQNDWALENLGLGPALNIRYSDPGGSEGMVAYLTTMAKGGEYAIPDFAIVIMRNRTFTVEYESLSGTKYSTIVDWPDGAIRTRLVVRGSRI